MISVPSLPDNIHRIIILIGLLLCIASAYIIISLDNKNDVLNLELNNYVDSVTLQSFDADIKEEKLLDMDTFFSTKFELPPIVHKTGNHSFTITKRVIGDVAALMQTDSVKKYWDDWENSVYKFSLFNKKIDVADEKIANHRFIDIVSGICALMLCFSGVILIIWGCEKLIEREQLNIDLVKRQNISLPKYFANCQSCSRRFSAIIKHGTDKLGSPNYAFCSECYNDGAFTEPNIKFEEIKQRVLASISSLDKKRQKKILDGLRNLDRWQNDIF